MTPEELFAAHGPRVRLKRRGIGGHTRPYTGQTVEWLTPPGIIGALGRFDLDPCSPVERPWATADEHYTHKDDGLSRPWFGRVWLNPPYGPDTGTWLRRLADHGNGIAIVFARTETRMFQAQVWDRASGILFFDGRLYFHRLDGVQADANAGGPSCLIAYGTENVDALEQSGLPGVVVTCWQRVKEREETR